MGVSVADDISHRWMSKAQCCVEGAASDLVVELKDLRAELELLEDDVSRCCARY